MGLGLQLLHPALDAPVMHVFWSAPHIIPRPRSLAQANLVTLLAYCYSAGLVGAGLCYSLLGALRERFNEADVSAMVTLLNAVRRPDIVW